MTLEALIVTLWGFFGIGIGNILLAAILVDLETDGNWGPREVEHHVPKFCVLALLNTFPWVFSFIVAISKDKHFSLISASDCLLILILYLIVCVSFLAYYFKSKKKPSPSVNVQKSGAVWQVINFDMKQKS